MSNTPRWSPEDAWSWYRKQPWLVGCNFLPSTAINQLEMFQADDYDKNRDVLARELTWSSELGMNTHRVFLHDLLWSADPEALYRRLDDFLELCAAREIRPMLVFFDACHRPEPRLGVQPAPTPGKHNPGWAQSPQVSVLMDESQWGRLERYVTAVLGRHGRDERILCWDLYNEPCNSGFDLKAEKCAASARLVPLAFQWARAAAPTQPLTVCVWHDFNPAEDHDASSLGEADLSVRQAQRDALALSDIITFHNYGEPSNLQRNIERLTPLGRPLLCTEYMARTRGSLLTTCLPVLKEAGVAAYNWGLVAGKSQTMFPWGSPEGAPEPDPWFHDLLRPDGEPYDPMEVEVLRQLTV